MKIKSLNINNYKSLVDVKITNPSPFSVFVGPNASGKSSIFEALEFLSSFEKNSVTEVERKFGGLSSFANQAWISSSNNHILNAKELADNRYEGLHDKIVGIQLNFGRAFYPYVFVVKHGSNEKNYDDVESIPLGFSTGLLNIKERISNESSSSIRLLPEVIQEVKSLDFRQGIECFSRIFIGNNKTERNKYEDDKFLSSACGNLEKVLKRVLKDEKKRVEIIDWLQSLVPGFDNIEIKSEELSGSDNLLIYEKGIEKPFNKSLISDGTYNIIALLTAVYQSNEPQFICIEEPENGLNPKVVKELVVFFRQQCEEKGHYIWLNTHSQTLVRELSTQEIIIVEKKAGATQVKQIQGMDLQGMKMDDALLTNSIGGGIPW